MKGTVAVLSTSRADYSHLYWVLKELEARPEVDLKLIVTGAHLAEEFGRSVEEMEKDGFHVDERVEALLSSDTDVGMAKTIGVATLGLAEALGRLRNAPAIPPRPGPERAGGPPSSRRLKRPSSRRFAKRSTA